MRPLSTLLDRFRRGVAVPAAAGDDLAAELAPVFASLESLETEADAIAHESAQRADDRLAEGLERAASISARWREIAEAERANAAALRRRQAQEDAAALEARGQANADSVRERAAGRAPELVERIVACVERATEAAP